ncbi:hypothetical protein MTR_8g106415 [Medicago truncatula]|uniref:Spt20-like SEP domain-containing protein n=1 Tax=Medicago truncatula TaxID=3880 RepID=A0A072TV87_MEDTR|nr:hypothetical protein MTR_8g106415 [Medicago truncatula]
MVVSFKVSKIGIRFNPKPKTNPMPPPLQPSQDDQTQVRDYRRYSTVSKVCLKMSLENIVKDIIPSLSDKSWTYGDIMEVESKIVKALHPNLHLNSTPKLNRLCQNPLATKV